MPGSAHGPSIKNPRVYDALRRKGYDKARAAAISNALVKGGYGSTYRALVLGGVAVHKAEYYDVRGDDGKFSESGGGGGAKEKPAPKKAPAEEKDERTPQEKANQNRASVAEQTGLGKDLDGAMARLAAGMGGQADEAKADQLVERGLAKKDPITGRYSLSPDGRAYFNAAKKGDLDGARAAMGAGEDRAAGAKAKAQAKADKEQAAKEKAEAGEKAKADKEKAKADKEKEKKKGGGGGGGGGEKKPDAADAATTARDAGQKAGLKPATVDALRDAADGKPPTGKLGEAMRAAGLSDADGLTPAGRKVVQALEKGDVRGVVALIADARRGARAAGAKDEADAERRAIGEARAAREREMLAPWIKRAALPYGVGAYVLAKHAAHNQKAHGRKGRAGQAGMAAYRAARVEGKSHTEARAAGRAATASERGRMREERTQAKAAGGTSDDKDGPRGRLGEETRAYGTDPNQSYTLQHRLVDMSEIQASNTANGAINPNYDPRLQPRDRSRAASQAQIDGVAKNLNADVLVTDFHRIDGGSPVIDANGNVLSGNGRTLALQRAADMHPDQYAAYKARMRDEATRLGIDPAEIDRMERPVLVRELKGDVDAAAFAREANSSGTLRMSPLEQARVDAGQISDRSLLNMNIREGQDIDRALRDPGNKPFINEFLATVPDNERATLLTRNGDLNQMGLYRIKAAVYTRAFPGEAGGRMAESMLESLDPDVKSVQNGISGALPNISRASALIKSGARARDLDLTDDLARSVDTLARIKDNPALTANTPANQVVRKYLAQSQMFDRELNPTQEKLLLHLDGISRKPAAVREFLDRWASVVERQPAPGQSSLFGDDRRMTKDELVDLLISGGGGAGSASTGGLFE